MPLAAPSCAHPRQRTLAELLDEVFPPMTIAPAPHPITGGYEIPGVARVMIQRPRNRMKRAAARRHAIEFAERIAESPNDYLPVLLGFKVPGIIDLRKSTHRS